MDTLYRSSDEGMLAGVCAGLARKYDLNVTGLRWAVVLVSLFLTGIPIIAYLILCVVLKPRPTSGWV